MQADSSCKLICWHVICTADELLIDLLLEGLIVAWQNVAIGLPAGAWSCDHSVVTPHLLEHVLHEGLALDLLIALQSVC